MPSLVVTFAPAEDPMPFGAGPSAGIVMTKLYM